MLTGHGVGQRIKSEMQVNRSRMEIAANHYGSSFHNIVEWLCGIFYAKLTPFVVALVDGFVLRIAGDEVYITTEDVQVEDWVEAEDLGEASTVAGFRHTVMNGKNELILVPAKPSTKALFYDAIAHDGLLEQCELLAHVFKVCAAPIETSIMRNKINSIKANTGRFPSLFKIDDYISEMRGEPFLPSSEVVSKVGEEGSVRNDNTETYPL